MPSAPAPPIPAEVVAAFTDFGIDPKPIGRGAYKTAYRTLEPTPRVLKVVHEATSEDPDGTSEGAVTVDERIRREIELLKSISHPNIVPVLDGPDVRLVGSARRVWYIEEYFPGGTLTEQDRGPLDEAGCALLLLPLVNAVQHLWEEHGVVHRDIKPDNIVFNAQGEPVLLDLGIAYFQSLSPMTNALAASPMTDLWSAPEQHKRRSESLIDYRTDLFLIGLVGFAALTGVHPFRPDVGDTDAYLDRLFKGNWDEQALAQTNPSPAMWGLLRQLLQPQMNRRFRKFEHVYRQIEECS